MVAKGYLTKLFGNDAIKNYITRHESVIPKYLESVMNTSRMKKALQQKLMADGEHKELLEEDGQEQKGAK